MKPFVFIAAILLVGSFSAFSTPAAQKAYCRIDHISVVGAESLNLALTLKCEEDLTKLFGFSNGSTDPHQALVWGNFDRLKELANRRYSYHEMEITSAYFGELLSVDGVSYR